MRGSILPLAENLKGFYYDLIPTKIVNGKQEFELSTIPQEFNFAETSIAGATVFTTTKGLETKIVNIGGVFQTNNYKWKIQTSNAEIKFKVGAVIVANFNGVETYFTIKLITLLTTYNKGFSMTRIGSDNINIDNVPKIIELV